MPPPIQTISGSDPWEEHLKAQLGVAERGYTLDMDDEPEKAHLGHFGVLNEAITFLNREVTAVYQTADANALAHQRRHRLLAKSAILTGALAVVFAIIQMGLQLTLPNLTGLAGLLEAVAVIAGLVAVIVGSKARFDSQWFIQRHVAERLRMLKFRALGYTELWSGKVKDWEREVCAEVARIQKISKIEQVKGWAAGGSAEPFEPPAPECAEAPNVLRAFSTYYRWKRVEFQAAYFGKQAKKFREQSRPLAHLGLPLFFLTMVAVGLHFLFDWGAHIAAGAGGDSAAHIWRAMSVWTLALAALLPIASLGIRAWLGAFEHVRSASLFEAKQHALSSLSGQLAQDCGNLAATMHHIAHVEHFLEHEHREWLRLLLEAEWFL